MTLEQGEPKQLAPSYLLDAKVTGTERQIEATCFFCFPLSDVNSCKDPWRGEK
jgi:hypothetical protein